MMWWGGEDWAWWMAIPMTFGMIAFWGLVIWAVVTLVRPTQGDANPRGIERAATPEERLARRLADGDIDVAEYEERLDALRRGGVASPTR